MTYFRLEKFRRKGIIMDGALFNLVENSIKWMQLGFVGCLDGETTPPEKRVHTYRPEELEDLIATGVAVPIYLEMSYTTQENISEWKWAKKDRHLQVIRVQRNPNETVAMVVFLWTFRGAPTPYQRMPLGKFLAYIDAGKIA